MSMQSTFTPGQTVAVPRGGDDANRPYLYLGETNGLARVATSYGEVHFDPEALRAWSQGYQDDWAAWLEVEALRAERAARELRSFANLAKLSGRNAAIESTGASLRRVVYVAREEPDYDYEVVGYWADGHDWTGKRELIPADGSASLYLFDDEVRSDESWPA